MKFDCFLIITERVIRNAKVGICFAFSMLVPCLFGLNQFQLEVISGSCEITASESCNSEVIIGGFVVYLMFAFSFPERLKTKQNYQF